MRWLLAILILLNGVAFYWFSGQSPQSVENAPVPEVGVRRLLLLSEMRAVELEPAAGESCVVIGPMARLSFRQWLEEELSHLGIRFQVWSEQAVVPEGGGGVDRYWLQFHAARQGDFDKQLLLDIEFNNPQSKIEEKTCSVVASAPHIP